MRVEDGQGIDDQLVGRERHKQRAARTEISCLFGVAFFNVEVVLADAAAEARPRRVALVQRGARVAVGFEVRQPGDVEGFGEVGGLEVREGGDREGDAGYGGVDARG